MSIKSFRPEFVILICLAFATRLWQIFQPAAVVFDEVYFKVYAGNYLTGAYYFDPHPPLGKLILAGWAWLTHLDPGNLVATDQASVILRLLPAIAGALIIPVFYVFLRQIKASHRTAMLGATLLLLENALLVESRFVLLDSILILFGLSAITLFLYARRFPYSLLRIGLYSLAALLAGITLSIKWTGLTALGLIGLVWLIDQVRHHRHQNFRWSIAEAGTMALAASGIYVISFFIHFHLLPKTGQGDAFMSQRFQSTLQGSPYYQPATKMSSFEKFIELNQQMIRSEESLKTATHPYGSKWYSWPMMIRDVYYWQGPARSDGRQGHIYLLGNPVVWWGSLALIPLSLAALAGRYQKSLWPYRFPLAFLTIGYCSNILPFAHIVRVMFLYHYFFALIFCLAAAVLLLQILTDQAWPGVSGKQTRQRQIYIYASFGAIALAGFIYFAPLTYGFALTPTELQNLMWLKTWR